MPDESGHSSQVVDKTSLTGMEFHHLKGYGGKNLDLGFEAGLHRVVWILSMIIDEIVTTKIVLIGYYFDHGGSAPIAPSMKNVSHWVFYYFDCNLLQR